MRNNLSIALTEYEESLTNLVNYIAKEYGDEDYELRKDVNLREVLLLKLINDFIENAGDIKKIAMELDLERITKKITIKMKE